MRLKALCPEPNNYSDAGLAAIRSFADLEAESLNYRELLARVENCDLLFVRLKTFVDDEILKRAGRLKAIVSPTTGLNHIRLDVTEARGIKVFHLRGEVDFLRTVTSTAEHTWALLLALIRDIPAATTDVLNGFWQQDVRRGRELQGKRLGILGFGRLGRIVARYGHTFGMKIGTFDIHTVDTPEYVEVCRSMAELFSTSDILSVHVPLNAETKNLIGRDELFEMPEGAVLVNTSRGEIIDEPSLIDALDSGRVRGAALDVVANEKSYEANRLITYARTHSNLLITPHIGGATFEAIEKTDLFVIRNLISWLDGPS
ncbi:MAG: NAD(P)-dependent oxidoreductase [Rhodothermia bacterium]